MVKNQKKKIIQHKTKLILITALKKHLLIKSYKKTQNISNKKCLTYKLISVPLQSKSICLLSGKKKAIIKKYKFHRSVINKIIRENNLQNISLNAK